MNTQQLELLKQHLEAAFADYQPQTRRLYIGWVVKLVKYHQIPLRKMEQRHITEFQAYLVRPGDYSRSSCNQAARAIKVYFESISKPVEVVMVSARNKTLFVDTVTADQARGIMNTVPVYYRPVMEDIYFKLIAPGKAVKAYPSPHLERGGHVTVKAVNDQIKKACRKMGIIKPCRAKMLHQSGILHALETDGPAEVAQRSGLSRNTIARYLRQVKPVR